MDNTKYAWEKIRVGNYASCGKGIICFGKPTYNGTIKIYDIPCPPLESDTGIVNFHISTSMFGKIHELRTVLEIGKDVIELCYEKEYSYQLKYNSNIIGTVRSQIKDLRSGTFSSLPKSRDITFEFKQKLFLGFILLPESSIIIDDYELLKASGKISILHVRPSFFDYIDKQVLFKYTHEQILGILMAYISYYCIGASDDSGD